MAVIIIITIIIYVVLTVSSSGGPMSSRLTQILATNRFVQIMKADFPIIWGRFPTNKKSVFINKEIIGDRPVISRKRQSSGKLWSSTFWKRKNSSHLTFAGSLKTRIKNDQAKSHNSFNLHEFDEVLIFEDILWLWTLFLDKELRIIELTWC